MAGVSMPGGSCCDKGTKAGCSGRNMASIVSAGIHSEMYRLALHSPVLVVSVAKKAALAFELTKTQVNVSSRNKTFLLALPLKKKAGRSKLCRFRDLMS